MIPAALSRAAVVCAAIAAPPGAGAFEIAAAAGIDNLRGDGDPDYAVESRTGPLWTWPRLGIAAAVAIEADDRDLRAGAGPAAVVPLTERLRLEASVMLGDYGEGERGDDLGAEFPMSRSQIGIGVETAESWWTTLAIDHKSNASTATMNPGVESLLLSIAHRF